jgi:hypothetical protein
MARLDEIFSQRGLPLALARAGVPDATSEPWPRQGRFAAYPEGPAAPGAMCAVGGCSLDLLREDYLARAGVKSGGNALRRPDIAPVGQTMRGRSAKFGLTGSELAAEVRG